MPTVDEYLAGLPEGIDSYPEAMVKGSVVRAHCVHPAFLEVQRDERMPRESVRLIDDPPTRTTWVREAHFNALMAGLYEHGFRASGGYPAYQAWVCDQSRRLFETKLYRVLFAVLSPERLLAATALRWSAFHQGSTLALVGRLPKAFEVEMRFPARLYPPASLHGFSGAFRAALLAAGGDVTSIEWTLVSPSIARWLVQWK